MVMATTPRLEFVPQVNLSRFYLFKAADALERGNVCEAGVLLREAIRRQLYAECAWKGCLPVRGKHNRKRKFQAFTPLELLKALRRAGHCGAMGYEWTAEAIDVCNKCAHCVPVQPGVIRLAIEWWHTSIDADPCGEPKDRPINRPALQTEVDDDCDCDDDHGDDWKQGGGV